MKRSYTDDEHLQHDKTKNPEEGTVDCITCRKTIRMIAEHSVGLGVYECDDCRKNKAKQIESMLHGVCPRCTEESSTPMQVEHRPETWESICSDCGFTVRHNLHRTRK